MPTVQRIQSTKLNPIKSFGKIAIPFQNSFFFFFSFTIRNGDLSGPIVSV